MKKTFLALSIIAVLILIGMTSAFCEERFTVKVHVTHDPYVSGSGTVHLTCNGTSMPSQDYHGAGTYYFPNVPFVAINHEAAALVVVGDIVGSDTHILTLNTLDFYVYLSSSVPYYPPVDPEDPEE